MSANTYSNSILLSHNALQCVDINPGASPFIHRHLLHWSPATELYLLHFVQKMSEITDTSNIELYPPDMAMVCKMFWSLYAYDPSFTPLGFGDWFKKCHLINDAQHAAYISSIPRLNIFRLVSVNAADFVHTKDLIKQAATCECAHIVHSHEHALSIVGSDEVKVIEQDDLVARRKPMPELFI